MKTQTASSKNVLIEPLSEPLHGATAAKIELHVGDGNLFIDRLPGGEPLLASGRLEYFEKQGVPTRSLVSSAGHATLTLRAGNSRRVWLHLPWSAVNGANEWQLHLNPAVACDITAHSDGGNVMLDLAGMAVTRVAAETGGGNVEVALPENAADLHVTAKTGGGNVTVEMGSGTTGSCSIDAQSGAGTVTVQIPGGMEARIHATSGWGKVMLDPRFHKSGPNTFQSPGFDGAANRVEITAGSGAGNVSVNTV